MKIYTKTGDEGETGLLAGQRVAKDHPRVEACGTVDELNAVLGLARAAGLPPDVEGAIQRVQNELFNLGSQLAAAEPTLLPIPLITDQNVTALEHDIDRFEQSLTPLSVFILPAGDLAAASLHVARTVCRRAERRVVTLGTEPGEAVSEIAVRYLNRLSDFLFVAARLANARSGAGDVAWRPARNEATPAAENGG